MDRGIDRESICGKENAVKCQLKELWGEYMHVNCKSFSTHL